MKKIVHAAAALLVAQWSVTYAARAQTASEDTSNSTVSTTGNPELRREIEVGFRISPVRLDLASKNVAMVGLGSYLVNAVGGCNDCHTNPSYEPGHNPYLGQPKRVSASVYLGGGTSFGPGIVSRNLTPERGLPAGRNFDQFLQEMRTGADLDHPGQLLQVMPWPTYQSMTTLQIRAIYTYLSAIPPVYVAQ